MIKAKRIVVIKPTKENKTAFKKRGLFSDDSRLYFHVYAAVMDDKEYSFPLDSLRYEYLLKDLDLSGIKY